MLESISKSLFSVWDKYDYTIKSGCSVVTILVAAWSLTRWRKQRKRSKLRDEWDNVGKDVVLLHQFVRGKFCPNLSPYALKVETFLRLNDIKYQIDNTTPFGNDKGKCPWMTLNGEDTADSEFMLDRLTEHFELAMDAHRTSRESAQLEAARILVDEHLFWCVVTWRYWTNNCKYFMKSQTFSFITTWGFPRLMPGAMKRRAQHHGIGKHSSEELFYITKKACATLSDILGDDVYFGGNKPARADCSIFGCVAQLMWNVPGSPYEAIIKDTYPNLAKYCVSMKEHIYPDWNNLLNPVPE